MSNLGEIQLVSEKKIHRIEDGISDCLLCGNKIFGKVYEVNASFQIKGDFKIWYIAPFHVCESCKDLIEQS